MDNELCHYGVKGQKWGVRRDHDKSSGRSSGSSRSSKAHSTVSKTTAAKARTLKNKTDIREKLVRGKESVDRFMQSPAGKAVKVAAVIGLSYAGMGAALSVANLVAFGQSPLRTLGLDGFDSAYTTSFTLDAVKSAAGA